MPAPSPSDLLQVAEAAADAAAEELRMRFSAERAGEASAGVRAKSTPTDLVSEADLAAERAIRRVLGERRPQDAILGEEEGETPGAGSAQTRPSGLQWVVDPLDGTVNFLFGIPVFAVSVACRDAAGALAGVVLDPIGGERFTATRSGAALRNGEPITGPRQTELAEAMLATGFAYDTAVRARQATVLAAVLPLVRDIRRAGAAALDLCWTASGRYDAYYERGVKPWDIAAGALIAQRAGFEVRDLPATEEDPIGVLVAAPALVDELMALVVGD